MVIMLLNSSFWSVARGTSKRSFVDKAIAAVLPSTIETKVACDKKSKKENTDVSN